MAFRPASLLECVYNTLPIPDLVLYGMIRECIKRKHSTICLIFGNSWLSGLLHFLNVYIMHCRYQIWCCMAWSDSVLKARIPQFVSDLWAFCAMHRDCIRCLFSYFAFTQGGYLRVCRKSFICGSGRDTLVAYTCYTCLDPQCSQQAHRPANQTKLT
jgi:hypothetical protein